MSSGHLEGDRTPASWETPELCPLSPEADSTQRVPSERKRVSLITPLTGPGSKEMRVRGRVSPCAPLSLSLQLHLAALASLKGDIVELNKRLQQTERERDLLEKKLAKAQVRGLERRFRVFSIVR